MDLKLLKTGGWSFAGLLSLYAYTQAVDLPFAVHMLMFAAASVLMLYFTLSRDSRLASGDITEDPARYDDEIIRWGVSHYTDWTIGHVHSGALGWNGMITFACMYYMAPRVFGRSRMYSLRLINWHFWLATIGIVLYTASMWVAGITQGLMWREYGADGYLVNSFIETVEALHPMYVMRATGGLFYLSGAVIFAWNIYRTIQGDVRAEKPMTETPYNPVTDRPAVTPPSAQPAE